jgi:hypothetical protein
MAVEPDLKTIVHELRNLLQRVTTWANVIRTHGEDTEQREHATGIILECVAKQAALLKQIVGVEEEKR